MVAVFGLGLTLQQPTAPVHQQLQLCPGHRHYGGAGYVTQGVGYEFTTAVRPQLDVRKNTWTAWRRTLSSAVSARISRCHFLTRRPEPEKWLQPSAPRGGAILPRLTRIDIAECHFTGNCALNSYYNNGIGGGGIISFEGASQKATINRCSFVGNKATGFTPGTTINAAHTKGDIMVRGGTLAVTNALIADARRLLRQDYRRQCVTRQLHTRGWRRRGA